MGRDEADPVVRVPGNDKSGLRNSEGHFTEAVSLPARNATLGKCHKISVSGHHDAFPVFTIKFFKKTVCLTRL